MTAIAALIAHVNLGWAEQLAGRLLTESARRRLRRGDTNDAHEVRHLFAAILAGNSSPCGMTGAYCHLDRRTLDALHDASFPGERFIDVDSAWTDWLREQESKDDRRAYRRASDPAGVDESPDPSVNRGRE